MSSPALPVRTETPAAPGVQGESNRPRPRHTRRTPLGVSSVEPADAPAHGSTLPPSLHGFIIIAVFLFPGLVVVGSPRAGCARVTLELAAAAAERERRRRRRRSDAE